jgi:hypothetical protein
MFRSAASMPRQCATVIESLPYIGFQTRKSIVPLDIRKNLIRKILSTGITHVQVGNLNDHAAHPLTRHLLHELKDERYGDRMVGTAMLHPDTLPIFLSSGADELILPVDMDLPYSVETAALFKPICNHLQSNYYPIRLQLSGSFSHPAIDVINVIESYVTAGVNRVSLLDQKGEATPSKVFVLSRMAKEVISSKQIAYGFQFTRHGAFANHHTALEEGIRTFHSCLGGIGNWTDTSFLLSFLYHQNQIDDKEYNTLMPHLLVVKCWLDQQLSTLQENK